MCIRDSPCIWHILSHPYAQLKVLLLPKEPNDEKNVIMEFRAGTGGDEAGLFAADLMKMYMRYACLLYTS